MQSKREGRCGNSVFRMCSKMLSRFHSQCLSPIARTSRPQLPGRIIDPGSSKELLKWKGMRRDLQRILLLCHAQKSRFSQGFQSLIFKGFLGAGFRCKSTCWKPHPGQIPTQINPYGGGGSFRTPLICANLTSGPRSGDRRRHRRAAAASACIAPKIHLSYRGQGGAFVLRLVRFLIPNAALGSKLT